MNGRLRVASLGMETTGKAGAAWLGWASQGSDENGSAGKARLGCEGHRSAMNGRQGQDRRGRIGPATQARNGLVANGMERQAHEHRR